MSNLPFLPVALALPVLCSAQPADRYQGAGFSGSGDVECLQLLDTCYQMLYPSPDLQNIGMLYNSAWNGFVEGPTWGAWWIQNSYGPTYCGLPFFVEPYCTFVSNAQDLWFSQMGDGKREGANGLVAPDGCLCDAAAPGWIVYKQGDGRIDIHDWGMEFTAAGVVLQAEQLLVSRDRGAIDHYLPMLERSANFIETRRDPANNCFLAGAAGNLLAPSHAGYQKPDGTYDKSYLAGLSVTYIAALDRLIELEKLVGDDAKAALYSERRELAREGLANLITDEGYFIKSLDPDGTRHGVYGAEKHGYFEAVCNHDAIAFRVADDQQSQRIYDKIASIPGLRRHGVIITNCPSLDDMYTEPRGLWEFGRWVNGGHWTTCEARMILAYYRLGKHDDARRAMEHLLRFAREFRFDNPLVDFGNAVYQPKEPINCVYDSWGGPLAMLRGLFEYLYTADGVTLLPHIPPGIRELHQHFPVRLGDKRLYLSTCGSGQISAVYVNGEPWTDHDATRVSLPYDRVPERAQITICFGGAAPVFPEVAQETYEAPGPHDPLWQVNTWWANPLGNGRPLRIGADSTGNCLFAGDMRRVRVHSRALGPDEIGALAGDPLAGADDDPALVVDLLFDRAVDGQCPNPPNPDLVPATVRDVEIVEEAGGKVARFSGDGYLEVPADTRITLSDYTLDAWIRPGALPASGARIIDRVTAGVDDGYLLDTFPGNSLRLITERGHLSYGANLQPGKWVHVAATCDGENGLRLYLDGKSVAQGPAAPASPSAFARIGRFYSRLVAAGEGDGYEAGHCQLIIRHLEALRARLELEKAGKLPGLPPASALAADKSYIEAAERLTDGLERVMTGYGKSDDPRKARLWALWGEVSGTE